MNDTSTLNGRTPVDADISYRKGEAKVRFFINGKKYAFICDEADLNTLETKEAEVIRKVTF